MLAGTWCNKLSFIAGGNAKWYSHLKGVWQFTTKLNGDFPSVPVVKNLPADAEDAGGMGSIPGWGRSPGGGNGNPLLYSWLENSMDTGAQQATVHEVASWT